MADGDHIKSKHAAFSLEDIDWQPTYSHEDGNLVDLFFNPALLRSCLYQRVTGYFSASVLALAGRGLDGLIANGGRMELIAGCTLSPDDVRRIEDGYKLREILITSLGERLGLMSDHSALREKLGRLSWMVANRFLDVKLAVPRGPDGKFHPENGLYHAKAGILTDLQGNRLIFTGSINETESGWRHNCESFTVSCSWRGEWDMKRVQKTGEYFSMLWNNTAQSAVVLDFPEALKQKLLKNYPPKAPDTVKKPPVAPAPEPETEPKIPVDQPGLWPEERRSLVWSFLMRAAARPDGTMIAVKTGTVDPWPHQLRAYKRMLDNWPFRLLIADEVGLGKTIEAGMMIRHAWISGLAKRICIMVPSAVCQQWQSELYEKFNLLVPIYTGRTFIRPRYHFAFSPIEEKVNRDEWAREPLVIVSSHLMRRADRQSEIIEAEPWDLLVLDEAHHARRKGAGTPAEKGPNRLLDLMQRLKDRVGSLLLLTATPMQVHPVEIRDLIHILGMPEEWDDSAFIRYFETVENNPDAGQLQSLARLFQACERYYHPLPDNEIFSIAERFRLGKINARKVINALRETRSLIPLKRLSAKERKTALAVLKAGTPVRFCMSRHTRHLLRAYHEKGLLDSPIARRIVTDLSVTLSPAERRLYSDVEDYISTTWQSADPDKKHAVGFVMTIYRRRLASSFYALRKTLEKRLERIDHNSDLFADDQRMEEDLPQDEQVDEIFSVEETSDLEKEALVCEEKASIASLIRNINSLDMDTKALHVVKALENAFSSGYDSAIIFTQYTDTMHFLRKFLSGRMDLSIGCYSGKGGMKRESSGNWTTCSKEQIKRLLRKGDIRLLICTDAAGEGLNLQFCGVLVNYDLPWNPMKVEQRIGRIDRIGQKYGEIRIINMACADTVEADVYFALSKRIDLFNGVVGKLQPILSRIPKEFEASIFAPPEQREQTRHRLVSDVHRMIDEGESAGFDIDEVSDADLKIPEFPEPPYLPSDLDGILIREDLLPPGMECKRLDAHTYSLSIPGRNQIARITTSPAVFDEHFENHQLLLPDSPLFRKMVDAAGPGDESALEKINHISEIIEG